jgi:hypothetical protein
MSRLIDREEFWQLFQTYEHAAFRLESLEHYSVDGEEDSLAAFVAGDPVDESWIIDWAAVIKPGIDAGKRFERVRVVSEPHSDYTRYSLDQARLNVSIGEDIRYLSRSQAQALGLPTEDFWLFDSKLVLLFHFDDTGRVTRRELIDDPTEVVKRNYWRDVAWHYAIGRQQYAAAHGMT